MDTPTAPALPRTGVVVAHYEKHGYCRVRETGVGVVLRHPNGGMITVLANGETRGGDKAGPSLNAPDHWWAEPAYFTP